jgi:hypothetical protein
LIAALMWLAVAGVFGLTSRTLAGAAPSVGLMLYLLGALAWLFRRIAGSLAAALSWLMLASALAASTPVWLGPLIARLEPDRGTINLMLAGNPLTHLAAGTATDYLRSDWFYRHSPLGGLRYDYASSATTLTGYLAACLLTSAAARRPRRARRAPADQASPRPTNPRQENAP